MKQAIKDFLIGLRVVVTLLAMLAALGLLAAMLYTWPWLWLAVGVVTSHHIGRSIREHGGKYK